MRFASTRSIVGIGGLLALSLAASCIRPTSEDAKGLSSRSPAIEGATVVATEAPGAVRFDAGSVVRLRERFVFDTGATRGHQGPPVVSGDTLYVFGPYPDVLWALDARTGAVRWNVETRPAPASQGVSAIDTVNGGATLAGGRVYVSTVDGNTLAVDAATGEIVWEQRLADLSRGETMAMAPFVVKDRVLVADAGAEFGARGWLQGLDAATGAVVWTAYTTGPDADVRIGPAFRPFYEADRGPDLGVHGWPPEKWKTGGGTITGAPLYDPELDLVFVGTGAPAPWNPEERPGDDKWCAGIFARRPSTGDAVWYTSINQHDPYAYGAEGPNLLLDLDVRGKPRKVLLHADHDGYVTLLDRATGELLSAQPITRITTSRGVDLEHGRMGWIPIKEPQTGTTVRDLCPASPGAVTGPLAFSPRTKLVYLGVSNLCQDEQADDASYVKGTPYLGAIRKLYAHPGVPRGELVALDPATGRVAFRIAEKFPVVGGAAVAGDVVLYGTLEGKLRAVDARDGRPLFEHPTRSGIIAPPVPFRDPDGRACVAVVAGVGGWAGVVVSNDLDVRDASAGFGVANALRDLKGQTRRGGTLHVLCVDP